MAGSLRSLSRQARRRFVVPLALLATVLAPACSKAAGPTATGLGDPGPVVRASPSEAVTVTGRVGTVLGARVFSIDDDIGGNLVVVVATPTAPPVEPGMQVRVSGEVVDGDLVDVAHRAGVPLPERATGPLTDLPCLLAPSVTRLAD